MLTNQGQNTAESEAEFNARWEALMADLRPAMEKRYYDPARYPTYLEQLGVAYPGPTPAGK